MGDSLSTAWNKATNNMRCLVLCVGLLASSASCSTQLLDAGYGVPAAPVVSVPRPVLNHVVHTIPASIAPAPVAAPLAPAFHNFVPVNQVFAPEQFSFVPAPVPAPQ